MIISSGTGDAGVCFRVTDPALGANLFDGYYLGLYPNKDIVRLYEWPHQDIIKQVSKTIDFNVEYHIKIVTDGSNIKAFVNDMTKPLIEVNDPHHTTGTVGLRTYYTNVSFDNVSVELENDGCWVRLSDSSYVKLDKDPALGDETVDSDGDGIPDIIELKGKYSVLFTDPITYEKKTFDTWSFYSNPAKKDTDGDGIEDIDDLRPSIFDTVVLTDTELVTVFNTGRAWYKIACNSYDYLDNISYMGNLIPKNPIDIHTFLGIKNNVEKNKEQSFNIYELTYIGLVDNEGSKIYLHNKSGELREAIFRRLTNEESKYFKHSGILAWENWKEVPKGTKSGFFKGKVLSEADINFSLKLYYVVDAYTVLNTLVYTGATVIAVIVIVEATPVVLANIQGIIFYVKTFGIVEGLKMYQYLGVNNLPNSVITWVQWELADGDSSLDDILVLGTGSANTTKIYRVVNDVEFQLIKNGGQFEELPQYMSSKWFFANDIEYAKKWAQAYYPDGNYKIILIYAPNELLKGVYYTEKIDLIGPAYCFELDEINNILNSIKK